MKTSERFTNAVTKLYNAFHKGELNAMDECACAVGNMCGNKTSKYWHSYPSGYSIDELDKIEDIFMFGKEGGVDPILVNSNNKDLVFKALCEVVEYLCELEGIPNVMDYTSLFKTENEKPKHQLAEVF